MKNIEWYEIRVEEMNNLDSTWETEPIELNYLISERLNKFIDKIYLKKSKKKLK